MSLENSSFNKVTGGLIHDFIVCSRAAWYSYRQIRMENELMLLGKILHERAYKREIKNVFQDNISLDFIQNKNGEVWVVEVKKSSKMIEAARWQLLFYLYYLENKGIKVRGKLVVPKERYTEEVYLDEDKKKKLEALINRVLECVTCDKAPKSIRKTICEKCSYFELCWV